MPESTETEKPALPQPVQAAREALAVLRAEDPALADKVEKALPGYAMRQKGPVDVETLLLAARNGLQESKAEAKEKDVIDLYNEILARKDAAAPAPAAESMLQRLLTAAQKGHTENVKLLLDQGADITTNDHSVFRSAAQNGHTETVKFLLDRGADIAANNHYALRWAAQNGHTETVKLLLDRGADVAAMNHGALCSSAENGHTETVALLLDRGADVTALDHEPLQSSAKNGHTETVALLLNRGAEIAANSHRALREAAGNGNTETVRFLLDKGADVAAKNYHALRWAITNAHIETVKLLLDRGADASCLAKEEKEQLKNLESSQQRWHKTVRMYPPDGLHEENPSYFKKVCFEAAVKILSLEGYDGKTANSLAFHAAGLFQTVPRLLQYLEQWGENGTQPLHDLIYMVHLPKEGTPNLKDWGDAVLKCGPTMAKLVKFGNRLPSPLKSRDGKTWSAAHTQVACAKFAFQKSAEHPALSTLCLKHNLDEDAFNAALKIVKKGPAKEKNIPDICIDGEKFDMPGATFSRLPDDDIRGLFLGEMTNCCQSIGSAGAECAKHGYSSKDGGFYVVENAKGQVIGEAWAWRGKKGEMCLDSLETLGGRVSEEQWADILQAMSAELAMREDHDIIALHVGAGGATPTGLTSEFKAATLATPRDYTGYRDSKYTQILVWKNDKKAKTTHTRTGQP